MQQAILQNKTRHHDIHSTAIVVLVVGSFRVQTNTMGLNQVTLIMMCILRSFLNIQFPDIEVHNQRLYLANNQIVDQSLECGDTTVQLLTNGQTGRNVKGLEWRNAT